MFDNLSQRLQDIIKNTGSQKVLTDDNSNPIVIVLDDAPNDFIRDAFKVYYYKMLF